MKTYALVSLLLAWAAPLAAQTPSASTPLTLSQVLDEALAHYPSIEAARARIDAGRARTWQTQAARLPQVSAQASYSFVDPLSYVDFPTPSGSVRVYEQTQNNYDVGLKVRQLVTDFGRTSALVAASRTGELSNQDALEQIRMEVGYQAIGYYYSVVLLQASVSVADEEIRALREALRISEQRQQAGTVTHFDVLTTKVRLANAENRRTDTLAALQRQEAKLRQLLGRRDANDVVVQNGFPAGANTPARDALVTEALSQRPDLLAARHAEKSREQLLDAADRGDRPTVNAALSGGTRDGYAPSLNAAKAYVDATVALNVPIFTGHRVEGERREARAELRAAHERMMESQREAVSEIDSALADVAASSARLENADTLVAQAQEALTLAQSRYERGVITNFELLDAQSAARAAELSRIQARYDRVLADEALSHAVGRKPSA
ncbi:MAG TPA: TolC family protein [Opitutaceae bacterium]